MLFNWIKKNIVLTVILFIVVFVIIIPLIIQFIVSLPSIIPNAGNNDWIAYWGGFIGALLGGLVTLFGIGLSNMETRKQLQDSIRAGRNQMLEEKRIDKSPFFYVEQNKPIKNSDKYFFIDGNYEPIKYSLTEKILEKHVIGLTITNISKNFAQRLKIAAVETLNEDANSYFPLEFYERELFPPDQHLNFQVTIQYDKQQFMEKYEKETALIEYIFYVRMCYDTGYDSISRSNVSSDSYLKFWGRANKFNIMLSLFFEYNNHDNTLELNECRAIPLKIEMDGFEGNEDSFC